jgi:hypothetical protein
VNLKTLKICAFLAALVVAFTFHLQDKHNAVKEAITATTTSLNAKYDKALRQEEAKSLQTSKALQASANKMRDEKDAKINLINSQLNTVLVSLHNRPNRPPEAANDTGSSQACTARSLYAEDSEFLAREAARADSILAERDYYYQQYEEVRKKYGNSE